MARIASGGHRERQPRRQRAAELGARPIASQGWRPCWRQRTACAAARGLTVPRDRRRGGPPNPRLRARAPCPVRPPPHRRRPALLESRGKTSRAAQASPGPRGAHENWSWDTDLRRGACRESTGSRLPRRRNVRKPWSAFGECARATAARKVALTFKLRGSCRLRFESTRTLWRLHDHCIHFHDLYTP